MNKRIDLEKPLRIYISKKYRFILLLLFLSLNGVGGVGAIINKGSDEKFGNVFLKGIAQGALGGYLVFESKRMLRTLPKNDSYVFVYPSKILNSAGNSIIENAANNDDFWVRWHINFGFNRLDLYTKDDFKLRYRINLFPLYGTILYVSKGIKIDYSKSLQLGTIVFNDNNLDALGRTGANIITLNYSLITSNKKTEAHELIHTYQYEQLSGINYYFNGLTNNLEKRSQFYDFYKRLFFTDLNYLLEISLHYINPDYQSNFKEKEARYFSIL